MMSPISDARKMHVGHWRVRPDNNLEYAFDGLIWTVGYGVERRHAGYNAAFLPITDQVTTGAELFRQRLAAHGIGRCLSRRIARQGMPSR